MGIRIRLHPAVFTKGDRGHENGQHLGRLESKQPIGPADVWPRTLCLNVGCRRGKLYIYSEDRHEECWSEEATKLGHGEVSVRSLERSRQLVGTRLVRLVKLQKPSHNFVVGVEAFSLTLRDLLKTALDCLTISVLKSQKLIVVDSS
jgi:hypothetical protein